MPWDLSNDRPIYLQLMERIQQDIVSGVYSPGDRLPSVRELALEYSFRGGLVLSPGGGFVENGFCPEVLSRRALVVHIIRTPDKKSFETRPLLRKEGAYDALKARRWPLYLKYRDFELLNEGSIIEGAENAARIYWENVR